MKLKKLDGNYVKHVCKSFDTENKFFFNPI